MKRAPLFFAGVLLACSPLPLEGDAGDAAPLDAPVDDDVAPDVTMTDGGAEADAADEGVVVPSTPWVQKVIPSGNVFDVVVDPATKHVIGAGYAASSPQRFIVAAYDATGTPLWNKNVTYGFGQDLALDAAGDVYVIGSTLGQGFDLGGGALGAGSFCVKYDSSGVFQWQYGPLVNTNLQDVRVTPNGTVVLAGLLSGSEDYGGGTVTPTGSTDVVVVTLDESGQYTAAKHWGTAGDPTYVRALAVDSTSAIYLGGTFEGSVDFGGGSMTAAPTEDGFIAKLTSSLAYVSQTHLQSTYGEVWALAVDSTDHLLAGVLSTNAMTLGGASVPAPSGPYGGFVLAKLDASLSDVWFKEFSGTLGVTVSGVNPAPGDAVVATGYYAGTIDLGKGALPTGGAESFFALKLDANGNSVASVGLGQSDQGISTEGWAVSWIEDDDVVIGGNCMGSLALPGLAPLTCTSEARDAVMARFQLH